MEAQDCDRGQEERCPEAARHSRNPRGWAAKAAWQHLQRVLSGGALGLGRSPSHSVCTAGLSRPLDKQYLQVGKAPPPSQDTLGHSGSRPCGKQLTPKWLRQKQPDVLHMRGCVPRVTHMQQHPVLCIVRHSLAT